MQHAGTTISYNSSKIENCYEEALKKNCAMDVLPLEDDTMPYFVYQCHQCKGHPKNICEWCFDRCHGIHSNKLGTPGRSVHIREVQCECGMNSHNIDPIPDTLARKDTGYLSTGMKNKIEEEINREGKVEENLREINTTEEIVEPFPDKSIASLQSPVNLTCHAPKLIARPKLGFMEDKEKEKKPEPVTFAREKTEIIDESAFEGKNPYQCPVVTYLGVKYAFSNKTCPEEIKCIYCIKFCYPNYPDLSQFSPLDPKVQNPCCSCQGHSKETTYYVYLKLLTEEKIFDIYIDKIQLPSKLINIGDNFGITKEYYRNLYSSHFLEIDKKVNKDEREKIYQLEQEVIHTFPLVFQKDYFALTRDEEGPSLLYFTIEKFQDFFSFDTLMKMFPYPPPEIFYEKPDLTCNDYVVDLKRKFLHYSRKMVIMPKLKHLVLAEFGDNENISPVHRFVFRKTTAEILGSQFIDINDTYLPMLRGIHAQILKFIDYKPGRLGVSKIIFEYLKFINIFNYFSDTFQYFGEIVDQVYEVITCYESKYGEQDEWIQTILAELVMKLFLKMNDMKVTCKIISDSFCFDHYFCFERGKVQKKLLKILFRLPGPHEIHSQSAYIKKQKIYDMLISKFDKYSETIKSIIEAKDHAFLQQFLENPPSRIDHLISPASIVVYYQIDQIKTQFYKGHITHSEFYDSMLDTLETLLRQINYVITSKEKTEFEIFSQQVNFVKSGLIDILSRLYSLVYSEEFDKNKAQLIQEFIKNLCQLLASKNPFIAVIFFSLLQIETLMSKDVCPNNIHTALFYENLIKILKKGRYRFDTSFFIKTIFSRLKDFNVINDNGEKDVYFLIQLNMIKKCLTLSTDQSRYKSHSIVGDKISEILANPQFTTILRNIRHASTPALKFIYLVFEILNSLSNYAFTLCNANSFIGDVEDILYTWPELDFKERRIFTKFLARCLLESPFRKFQGENDRKLLERDLWNLLDGIKTDDLLTEPYSEIDIDEKVDTSKSKNRTLPIYGLRNVLITLKKYQSLVLRRDINESRNIQTWKMFIKYFNDAIFAPATDALYKLSYFAPQFPLKWKYLIFTITDLFFLCFRIFLDYCQKMIHGNKEIARYLSNYIKIDDLSNINKNTGVIIGLLNGKIEDFRFKKINSFDVGKILSSWEEIAKFWLPFAQTNKFYNVEYRYESNTSEIEQKSNCLLYYSLVKAYERYIYQKSNFDYNVLSALIRKEHQTGTKPEQKNKKVNITKTQQAYKKPFDALLFGYDLFSQLFYLSRRDKSSPLSPNHVKNYRAMERIVTFFQIKPELLQEIFTSNTEETRHIVFAIVRDQLPFFLPLIFLDFNKRNCRETYAYEIFVNALEFLRLLCENHNVFMQSYFIRISEMNTETAETDFVSFLHAIPKCITNHLSHWISKKPIVKNFHKPVINFYFNDLIQYLFNFFIEGVQGTLPSNLDILFSNSKFKDMFLQTLDKNVLSIDYSNYINRERDFYILHVMRFINALVDEKNLHERHKRIIYDSICIKKLNNICICYFKKMLYYRKHQCRIDTEQDAEGLDLIEMSVQDIKQSEELLKDYGLDPDFENDIYSQIAFEVYDYMYHLAHEDMQKEGEFNINVQDHIADAKRLIFREDQELKFLFESAPAFEVVMSKFFQKLYKTVQVTWIESHDIRENEEKKYEKLFDNRDEWGSPAHVPVLDADSQITNNKNISLGNEAEGSVTKIKNAIMEEIECSDEPFPVFFRIHPDGIFIESDVTKKFLLRSIMDGGEGRDHILSFLTDKEDGLQPAIEVRKRLEFDNASMLKRLWSLKIPYHTRVSLLLCVIVNMLMLYSVSVNSIAQSWLIFYISLANFIYLGILLLICISVKTYSKACFSFYYFTVFPVSPITWSFLACGLGLFTPLFFFYSVQLFAAFRVVKTMSAVLEAIKLRYEQFLSAAVVIIVMVLFFSLLSFLFFKNEFYNPDVMENKCDSLFHCFFFALNSGLRSQSVGLPMYSYQNDTAKYWIEFFFDMIFYICLIFIMLNVINGIIVDTFQELRDEHYRQENLRENVCFICQLHRTQFEVKGKYFADHKKNEHNLGMYFQYLLKVMKSKEYDLNAMDTHVLECIKSKKTVIFPYKKACSLINL